MPKVHLSIHLSVHPSTGDTKDKRACLYVEWLLDDDDHHHPHRILQKKKEEWGRDPLSSARKNKTKRNETT